MDSMSRLRGRSYYNVLTPIASCCTLAALAGGAVADDKVVAAGAVDNDGVQLVSGDSLTNSGTINNGASTSAVWLFPGPGDVIFILNKEGAVISSTGTWGIGIDGTLGELTNHGVISAAAGTGIGVSGDVGAFLNTGAITSDGNAFASNGDVANFVNEGEMTTTGLSDVVGIIGDVETFRNSGTMTGGFAGVYIGGNVGSLENSGEITGQTGVGLWVQGTVADFANSGTISGSGPTSQGVGLIGDVGTFANSGEIISASDSGVYLFGNLGSLSNSISGSITGSQGIEIAGNLGVFTNSGAIVGQIDEGLEVFGSVTSLVNSGTIAGADIGVDISGDVGTFENLGTITGQADSAVDITGTVDSFVNTGELTSATWDGVDIYGDVGSFENSGTITGGDWGVGIDANIGTFTNSGTISGAGSHAFFVSGTARSVTNSGRILAPNGRGMELGGLITNFENTNLIESRDNGVTFLGGFEAASNSGTIRATAASGQMAVRINEPGGTFTNSGTIEGPAGIGYILATAGDNILVNSGTIIGPVEAVSFASGADGGNDTLIIETGSKLFGKVRFGAGADMFDFSGFQGSALLDVRGLDGETLIEGDNLYYFDEPNDIIGIVSATGSTAAGQVVVTDIAVQISDLLASQINDEVDSADQDVALGYAPTPASSEAERAAADVALVAEPTSEVWGTVLGGGSHDNAPDLGHVFGGIIAGSHAQLTSGTTLGLLGGYTKSQLETAGNHAIESDTGVIGVYGSHSAGIADIDFSVLAGWSGHSSSRDFVALGAAETATANYSSWFIAPTLGAAVPVLAMDDGELRVTGRVGYIGGEVDGYTEIGSSMNLTVGTQTIGLLTGRVGLEAEFDVGTVETPATVLVEGGVFGQSNVGGNTIPISFLGQTQNIAAAGEGHLGVYGGFDLTASVGQNVELFAGADASIRDDGMVSGAATFGLSGSF